MKSKYITFGIEAENRQIAKTRLERIELDIVGNFKAMGVKTKSLDGKERLKLMFNALRPDSQDLFRFNWDLLSGTGLSSKDFIAPSSFTFDKNGKTFRIGEKLGKTSFLQILAPELTDRMLADFLTLENSQLINFHVQSIDQAQAIKLVKGKLSDIDKMKIDLQKKANQTGYDMDILPADLKTYGQEAESLLTDLQSRNERMFLVTVILSSFADNKRQLDDNVFQTAGIALKYNCKLQPLDYMQEQGLVSSLPIGSNKIPIERGLTTSALAIFVPFTTRELFQGGEALYYGLNALSNNMIMCDRKTLKNPNGLILGTPGCFTGDTRVQMADGTTKSFYELAKHKKSFYVKTYDFAQKKIISAKAVDVRITKSVDRLRYITFADGSKMVCTSEHLILNEEHKYVEAETLKAGDRLSGGNVVAQVGEIQMQSKIPVYDFAVPRHHNFILENGLIVHNSGKSFSAKREITGVFFRTSNDIIICDPEGEYYPLVSRLKGTVIKVSPNSSHYINPMDIVLHKDDDENPIALKADFILSLCDLILGGKDELQPIEKTVIDRCVHLVYKDYLADPRPEKMPILQDLWELLKAQIEPEAKNLATALELYVTGSLNVFNNRTNIDVHNRIVCFDIKELGKELKKIGMLIVQDAVWNRVSLNRNKGISTNYYVDEFHLLLKEKQTAAYMVEIWKRFRKWGGIPTGITQNVKVRPDRSLLKVA